MFSFRPQKPDISEENEVKIETNCLEDDLYESIFHEEIYNVELPKNFNDVQQSQEKRNWIKTTEDELKVMKDRKVWKLVDPPPQGVKILEKTIYGLHQSGREWNKELDSILNSIGFETIKWCNCVYKMNNSVILIVYVDDILLFGIETSLDIEELGKVKYLLGVNFETTDKGIYLHQETYINRLITSFTDLPKTLVNLPFKTGCWLPPKIKEDEIIETELMRKYPYRSIIGCLSFLADRSRPDIYFSVNTMAQFCNGYTYQHWKIVSAIYFCKNSVENIKPKHIDIRLQFIRKLEEEEFTLKFINSNLNLADFLTKPLSKEKLSRFIEKLFWR
ncbi:hypothetical protein LAZ67_7002131 [Cordylochernes scorpioides]|uniref:Reverse transcriptase Ty1/copia-type domain-containing protein n=1 Tax=Cordylochernes scorpioides TaxID=51811 RepID=A0ABY6KPF7_9ARAC|nr:hypothetical protein LAZ67_7002131 [Cordylochernes scorpioides]